MALTETNFRYTRIALSAAVFISLCVLTSAETVRRCHWCGPLAEQVHRSQRAPSCTRPYSQETTCDHGFPYCAIVATSPPYTESRYCVKLYQDECYSVYCNSSRTWRMTCPCRGNLCNGLNTEREEEAFSILAKLVAKQNVRIKRALISSASFISMNTNRKNKIDNTTAEEIKNMKNETDGNEEVTIQNEEIKINNTSASADADNSSTKSDMIDTTAISMVEIKDDKTEITETSPTAEVSVKNNDLINNTDEKDNEIVQTHENQVNETSIQIDIPTVNAESSNFKTEIIAMSSESTNLVNDTKINAINTQIADILTTAPVINKESAIEIKTMLEITTETTKTINEVKSEDNKVKPSEQLPTAEALQHNDTPTTKATDQMTTATTVMTIQHNDVTTTNKPRNNTAVRIDAHIITLVIGIILQY